MEVPTKVLQMMSKSVSRGDAELHTGTPGSTTPPSNNSESESWVSPRPFSPRLALFTCEIHFVDPDVPVEVKEEECKIPVGFLIDETCSQSVVSTSLTNLVKRLINKMQVLKSKVSDYVLTTVNDQSYREERNVFFKLKTSSPHNLMEVLDTIKFVGGGDSPERITQGLKVLFDKMEKNGLVIIFTDSPTKDPELMDGLLKKQVEMNLSVITVFYPKYLGQCLDESWNFYKKLGPVFELEDEFNPIRSLERSTLKILFDSTKCSQGSQVDNLFNLE